jgi:NAD(P)-dependent dehydrogenase (short-subunit alcohol dehydrogenase family)
MTVDYPDSDAVPNYRELIDLKGSGIVVIGAGQGMGRQTCHALAQCGATVLCVDREADLAKAIAAEVKGICCAGDATVRRDVEAVFDMASKEFGPRLKGVVDIVGFAHIRRFSEVDDATWQAQFDIVVRHAYLAIQIGAPLLADSGGGAMTFIGSLSAMTHLAGQNAYGAAKAALHHLVRISAHEYAPQGVRVNAVVPGFVRTPRLLKRIPDDVWQKLSAKTPLGRVAIPADVAAAVLFLMSDLSRYVTGNIMVLDGGITLATEFSLMPL